MQTEFLTLSVELTQAQAWEFAQFLKRAMFSTYRELARNDEEARLMQGAARQIQRALEQEGFAPR